VRALTSIETPDSEVKAFSWIVIFPTYREFQGELSEIGTAKYRRFKLKTGATVPPAEVAAERVVVRSMQATVPSNR